MPKEQKLSIGDTLPYVETVISTDPEGRRNISYDSDGRVKIARGVGTIVKIIELPEKPEERIQFIKGIGEGLDPKTEGLFEGKNLQDDPQYANRAEPDVIYIVQY